VGDNALCGTVTFVGEAGGGGVLGLVGGELAEVVGGGCGAVLGASAAFISEANES